MSDGISNNIIYNNLIYILPKYGNSYDLPIFIESISYSSKYLNSKIKSISGII